VYSYEKGKFIQHTVSIDGNAAMTMMHLYGAGTESTSTALRWAILYMCAYPKMQVKVHEEIDSVLGKHCPDIIAIDILGFICVYLF